MCVPKARGLCIVLIDIFGSRRVLSASILTLTSLHASLGAAHAADPWADRLVQFTAGTGGASGYTNAATALGSPDRIAGASIGFPSPITPFAPAFEASQLVSLGRGGSITVAFDEPVENDPTNPYGIDLLLFSNSFYADVSPDFTGTAGPVSSEGGLVEVSADGINWFSVAGPSADGPFPTLAFSDLAGPYDPTPGSSPTDFTRPVNPAFNAEGLTFAQIVAGYDGSGGGAGFDIASTGLASISFVRVTNPLNATGTPEIDAFADVSPVPAPSSLLLALAALPSLRRKR
jgi:hypothetical protein